MRYPVGVQSFEKIREEDYLYVDKTALIFSIIQEKGYFFLSRPRRFGKSLLLSTLEAYFKGRRDLFKGLALDSLTEDWEPRPVLHLDLTNGTYTSPSGLLEKLDSQVSEWEREFSIDANEDKEKSVSLRFGNLIKTLAEQTGHKVVILIDEYDKPLLTAINDPDLAEQFRSQLKAFYSNLKTM
ncbi:MAG: AAA family ATPase, partial [Muribaculaceae bacterium]|nr:AAA family ATPase [Muribaculaceae bacterium]